jgi:anti-sigma B factor antagonist
MTLAPEGDLVINTAHTSDGVLITVSGDLDADTAPQLRWQLDQLGSEPGVVALDMTNVPFCDSVGLACLVEVIQRGADLRLVGSSRVLKLLTLAGIDHTVRLASSVAEALRPDTR